MHSPRTIQNRTERGRPSAQGFTLTELIVAIAVAILLILGVNEVFRATSATVSAGMALSTANRDNLVAKRAFINDLAGFASDGMLIIRSEQTYAFRNATDKAGDSDSDPTTFNTVGASSIPIDRSKLNDRSHRIDRLGFFMRGHFSRQTGPPSDGVGPLTWATTSTEAWVWYGHLAMPNNNWLKGVPASTPMAFYNPGAVNSDNNAVASDWVLGRVAMLLDNVGGFAQADAPYAEISKSLDPLVYNTMVPPANNYGGGPLFQAPIDVADTSISSYINSNLGFLNSGPASPPSPFNDWYNLMIGYDSRTGADVWHCGSPYLRNSPAAGAPRISPLAANLTSFPMVRGCAHFIVEYAGDYLMQITSGVNAGQTDPAQPVDGLPHPDGNIDFYVDPANGDRKIRWYGFPRNTDHSGNFDGHVTLRDVVPLRDLMPGRLPAPFERIDNNAYLKSPFPPALGTNPNANNFDYSAPNALKSPTSAPLAYVCAWGPSSPYLPKMLRITIAIDDPNGRLNNTPLFEYVIDLQ